MSKAETGYINYYRHTDCPVKPGVEWWDQWSCACNDRCPECNAEIEPWKSEEDGTKPPEFYSGELLNKNNTKEILDKNTSTGYHKGLLAKILEDDPELQEKMNSLVTAVGTKPVSNTRALPIRAFGHTEERSPEFSQWCLEQAAQFGDRFIGRGRLVPQEELDALADAVERGELQGEISIDEDGKKDVVIHNTDDPNVKRILDEYATKFKK